MKIGVVGLGYVVEALGAGRSHVEDVPDESLQAISDRRGVTRGIEAPNLVRL